MSRHEYVGAPAGYVVVNAGSRVVRMKDHAGFDAKLPQGLEG